MLDEELAASQSATTPIPVNHCEIRHDWSVEEVQAIHDLSLNDLLYKAHSIHRSFFNPNQIQLSTLLNIKSGGCSEDCAYCPQSARYQTGVEAEPLLDVDYVKQAALKARDNGATRFCMGAAWRSPKEKDFQKVLLLVDEVKKLGMESCLTMGMLNQDQATRLKEVGLDYYNHNLDTSREYYEQIISTRDYDDRLETLQHVRDAGMSVCCGGIIGMGEATTDRLAMLVTLANMDKHPESVPINHLVKVEGTPLGDEKDVESFDMVRMIATTRCLMPASYVRLSAGRSEMSKELQAMCFFAGANSVFYGEKLLTTDNPQLDQDRDLFKQLGITPTA